MNDKKLWDAFSKYIRLRDADENGMCKCFTCSFSAHWTRFDCGHGIGRQHKATKYDERNNHAQCKKCNGFEGGKREVYKIEMDKRYGAGTWDLMEIKSKQPSKWSQFVIDHLTLHYKNLVKQLMYKAA